MDTRAFGTNLLDLNEPRHGRHSGPGCEDAYYAEHAPKPGRFFGIAAVVTAVWVGFTTLGLWPY